MSRRSRQTDLVMMSFILVALSLSALSVLAQQLFTSNGNIRTGSNFIMPSLEKSRSLPVNKLITNLQSSDLDIRTSAAAVLTDRKDVPVAAIPALVKALIEQDISASDTALSLSRKLRFEYDPFTPNSLPRMADKYSEFRPIALKALKNIARSVSDQAAAMNNAQLTQAIHELESAQADMTKTGTYMIIDTNLMQDARAHVSVTLSDLKKVQENRHRFSLWQWSLKHSYLSGPVACLVTAWTLTGLLFWRRPLALMCINDGFKKVADVGLPGPLSGVKLAPGYLLGVGFFHYHPRVLNAWVRRYKATAEENLRQRRTFNDRNIYVDMPIAFPDGEKRPAPADFHDLFARNNAVLLLWGDGGSGKTTLSCQMALWAMADKESERLCKSHTMLPVCIETNLPGAKPGESGALLAEIRGGLRWLIGESEAVSEDLVKQLLRQKRILLIVDGYSELNEATRMAIRPHDAVLPLNALVITSRVEEPLDDVPKLSLRTGMLRGQAISVFLEDYLKCSNKRGGFTDAEFYAGIHHFTSLIGNREITALLARLYAQHMINFKEQTVTQHPESIPSLMDEYVSEMCSKISNPAYPIQIVHPLACKIAWQCLRDTYTPTETPIGPILTELEKETVTVPAARTHLTNIAAWEPLPDRALGDKLTGAQFDQLQHALGSAFPSREALGEFTRIRLNENLELIAGGTNLSEALFKLIGWGESNGKLEALIAQAYTAKPHNPELRRFVAQHTNLAPMSAEPLAEKTVEEIGDGIGLPACADDPNTVLTFLADDLRLLRWCKITRREVKFTLDPLSEYLAACYLVAYGLRNDRARWNALLDRMEAAQNPEKPITGFVRALFDTCEAKGKEGPIPPDVLEELRRRFPDVFAPAPQNDMTPPMQQANTPDQAVVSTVARQTA